MSRDRIMRLYKLYSHYAVTNSLDGSFVAKRCLFSKSKDVCAFEAKCVVLGDFSDCIRVLDVRMLAKSE